MNIKKEKFIFFAVFLCVLAASFLTALHCLKYDMLIFDDYFSPYGRTFFTPEHGRYTASYLNHILIECLPEIFNIHPNDFQNIAASPLKIIVMIICFLYLAGSAFVFSKKNDNDFLKLPIFNPAFILIYAVIFLVLFNDFYFFTDKKSYFNIFENTVFWEYSASIVLYIIFAGILGVYFVKKEAFSKFGYTVLLISTFFLGISIEVLNLPALVLLCFLGIYLFIKKEFDRKYALLFIVYTASLLCYYAAGNDHEPVYSEPFNLYFIHNIIPFLKGFFKFAAAEYSALLIPILVLFIVILFISRHQKQTSARFLFFTASGIFSFLIFFAAMFSAGYLNGDTGIYWYSYDKFIYVCKTILLFYLLFTLSFLLDSGKINNNISCSIKVLLCICVLAVFHKNLITDYYKNINNTVQYYKAVKTAAYKAEKYAIESEGDVIKLPKLFKPLTRELNLSDGICGFGGYIQNVHPEIKKTEIKFRRKLNTGVTFSEKELEELKFSNLLKHKMHRHKKDFNDCNRNK